MLRVVGSERIIYASLEHHAMFAGSFGGIYDFPNGPSIVIAAGTSTATCLILFHGIYGHVCMRFPIGNDVNEVDIVAVA